MSTNLYALRKAAAEARLDELDPDWRERFVGDWQRAEDFYRPHRLGSVIGGNGNSEPFEREEPVYKDPDDIDFDDGLTEEDRV